MNGVIIAAAELLTFCERWDWLLFHWRVALQRWAEPGEPVDADSASVWILRFALFFRGINGPKVVAGCFPAWDRTANVRG
jgi:hypothetical protein